MEKEKRRIIAEAGIFLALAIVLEIATHFIPRLPQGGKFISLGMIPLLIFAILRGPYWGMLVGAGMGMLYHGLGLDPHVVHPIQYLLDYPIAFGLVGAAGFLGDDKKEWKVYPAILLGLFLRFLAHTISGILFIHLLMPNIKIDNVWLYSAGYNAIFMVPTTIVCLLIVPYLVRRLRKI